MVIQRRRAGIVGFLAGMTVAFGGATPASAQWGMGMGWGVFGVPPSPSTQFLNQHALNRSPGSSNRSRSHNPYSGNSNSYLNRVRDNSFVPRYDVARRAAPSYSSPSSASRSNASRAAARPATDEAPRAAVLQLGSFFDASMRLVWPNESPVAGDLREKRDVSDQATRAVWDETKQRGGASIANVTDARQKLIDYGRPALQEIREHATPPIADAFHRFLLSLYDSLAAAAPAG